MEYKIKDICNNLNIGVSKFYNLKQTLDNSIPEQNRNEFYYNKGRNFFVTEKGFAWFKDNCNSTKKHIYSNFNSSVTDVTLYQNQIIEIYKQRIEYLESENKRLLDIITVKEQKELTRDVHYIDSPSSSSFWNRFFAKFKK